MNANTVTFTASDGLKVSFPLSFLIERDALVVNKINGEDISAVMGAANQLWIPGFPAKYFVRDIASIEFSEEEEAPALPDFIDDGRDFSNRPNVSCRAAFSGVVGEPMLFEGWADDFDKRIVAVEFSLDEGENWTRFATENTDAVRLVWWQFQWTPEREGAYLMRVRSVNEDGDVSPIAATHQFHVELPKPEKTL